MELVADVHLHSRFARATSKELNPENLFRWSRIKGVNLVGTGDFTHPVWVEELRDKLEPAEEGIYRLRSELASQVEEELPPSCDGEVRFVLSTEIWIRRGNCSADEIEELLRTNLESISSQHASQESGLMVIL